MNKRGQEYKTHKLLGLPIDTFTKSELLEEIEYIIRTKKKTIIYGLCVGSLSRIKNKKRELPKLLDQMDIIVPDGAAIPLLGKCFGVPVNEVIAITELSLSLIKLAQNNGYKVLLLGATEENNSQAVKNLSSEYPDAILKNGINGYYDKNKEANIIDRINKEKPDILLIGMTYPLKEEFSVYHKDELSSSIIIPCGGAIDVFAGVTHRPPRLIKKLMLTWLYRWIQEPSRLNISPDIRFLFVTFPILLFKHISGIEKNPSIIKHYKLKSL